MYSIELFRSA